MKTALFGLCMLILFDLLTGIRATLHQKKIPFNILKKPFWTSIQSYLLRRTWRKAYEYGMGILVIATFETFIFGEPMAVMLVNRTFTLAEMATMIPALVEVWSIFENFEKVSHRNVLKNMMYVLPPKFRKVLTGKGDFEDDSCDDSDTDIDINIDIDNLER